MLTAFAALHRQTLRALVAKCALCSLHSSRKQTKQPALQSPGHPNTHTLR